ncbi:Csu type fimbrial protein [Klebsiella aerogenes]|uniref:Csu type fimbrial protein n=1 Tax=Klebsiella aerogenes TaxID=548 RepID=UPI00254FDCAA|nr:spore coat protein U domain-containing protein [Klebsiella aerogenes]EKZ5287279.1 spore coat U domain-containing protein [Klebsiella aerogenes]MDK7100954.1 spore coat protein U domain-containing protein [Klebsiella aerogenes]MDK7645680.1 spore coat protein U domain-containing protein [Klebsiella aerogenes]MDK7850712.1 spore coat protein U domain-containing protein [Klebsiella aerogenes]MDK8314178.1 spore coat protein U domain-containing protein [Klebsiella aerogenes]
MLLRISFIFLLLLSLKATAAGCWITSGASINFGEVAAGEAASTNADVKFSCQADYGAKEYINVCLSSVDTPPFKMLSLGDSEGKQYTLLFRLFNGIARSQELGTVTSGNLIQQTLLAESNTNVNGHFPLVATLPAGQSYLPATHYYNYNMNLRISWNSSSHQESLKSCADGSAEGEQIQGGSHAEAVIGASCNIEYVTPLNFGVITSAATLNPTRSSATLSINCPTGMSYSLAMGKGNHANGNQRQLCNMEGQCMRYGIWQDAGATQRWGDQNSGDTLTISNNAGGKKNVTVYGELPAQVMTGTGEFTDDVIITLTY